VKVVASSDAHSPQNVGAVAWSLAELSAQDFPEELVVNADYERFRAEIFRRRGLTMPE
jgi:histidinol phosphatase-like PHP family hydrolase